MDNSRHRFIVSLLAVLTTLSAAEAIPTAGARPAPKLVVNILVDRLRSDYLNAFLPLYGEDGFKRLLNQGLVYSQAESTALPTDMATAAADIATGTSASDHGIIGLRRLDRTTLRPVGCIDDKNFTGINTSTASSPQYLAVSTIGDELKAATEGKALV
ncbi:alkaline phosphatase family protein, partial [Alloprevotella tannerae]